MRFYCTSTGPIGGLNCEVLLCVHDTTYVTDGYIVPKMFFSPIHHQKWCIKWLPHEFTCLGTAFSSSLSSSSASL